MQSKAKMGESGCKEQWYGTDLMMIAKEVVK